MIPLNDETRRILGIPNFVAAGYAPVLRKMGHEIKPKAEEEQAAVIHWMCGLYEVHGDRWREVAARLIQEAGGHPGPAMGKS
jgi:hypothetical protein